MRPVEIVYNNTANTVDITLSTGKVEKDQPIKVGWALEKLLLEEGIPFNVKLGYCVNGVMLYA